MLLHTLQRIKLAHYKQCHFYLAVYPKIQNACAYVHAGITKMNKQRFAKIAIDLRRARSTLEQRFADSFIYVVVCLFSILVNIFPQIQINQHTLVTKNLVQHICFRILQLGLEEGIYTSNQ